MGRATPELQPKPAEPPRGSPLLPEPLKPQAAAPVHPTSQQPSVLKMQEPLKPVVAPSPAPSPQNLEAAPQPPPRSKSSQNLPSEPVPSEKQIKANGVYAARHEIHLNNDPFEDLSFQLLSTSKIQSVQMSPVVSLNQKTLTMLPSATDNFNTLSNVNCMQTHSSSNIFTTTQNSTNPFTKNTLIAGNPFRREPQESGVTLYGSTEGLAAYTYPTLRPPSHQTGKATFSINSFEDDFSSLSTSSVANNGKPKGWVTFEEDDFALKLKSLDGPTQLAGSLQATHSSDQHNVSSDCTVFSAQNRSSFHPLPARPPPAPPVPSRSSSTKPTTNPFISLAPKVLSTQDFTER
ncbi:hypothetical protein JRQ81_020036 [Phrynocephalus forsythii]|uniref:Synaptojanin 1 n=1 Tax=Phrynocephalus forsythii TaxID=171643 RepID=A0A9Q1AZD7_9SAUR|nr:hypothetical protein JRQ81_020036 [Phrynocephalus forsythii]